jgi:hypothetical protein
MKNKIDALELTEEVDLCLPDGRLNPDAIGWSRRPLHRCNLNGPWGRQKRWDHWAITTDSFMVTVTYADIDYLGLVGFGLFDFETKRVIQRGTVRPLGIGFGQGTVAGIGDVSFAGYGLSLTLEQTAAGANLSCRFANVEASLRIDRDDDESLNVVIPWGERRFQYTSKQTGLKTRGTIKVGSITHEIDGGFATLDYGRGVWPHSVKWNWANAAGIENGDRIGLQFGGKWTDGTGLTENGLMMNGRLHKIREDVEFEYGRGFDAPWTLRSTNVDLRFEPFMRKRIYAPLVVGTAHLNLCIGHFSGTVEGEDSGPVRIEHLLGSAEEFRGRW